MFCLLMNSMNLTSFALLSLVVPTHKQALPNLIQERYSRRRTTMRTQHVAHTFSTGNSVRLQHV